MFATRWIVSILIGYSQGIGLAVATDDDIFSDSYDTLNLPLVNVTPCLPSGQGNDYQVGPNNGQLSSIDQVPWENLGPGDTVRIFYQATPYPGKFAINAHGTGSAPVRVCGVVGPNGERPIIDGYNATSRPTMDYGRDSASETNQQRGIVMIVARGSETGVTQPEYIQIDSLKFQRAQPDYGFTDMDGSPQSYSDFGGCIWVEHGHHVILANNEITDCNQAIFSRSQDGDSSLLTMDLRISGNEFTNNGLVGSDTVHTTYVQSVGVTYEFNHYGAMRPGAGGNAMKDRSVGPVVRYNRIEAGAFAMDFVEAEDYPDYANSDPNYRTTFVYGNQIVKPGPLAVHYGGDHPGSEANYRHGTLYFYNNTVYMMQSDEGAAYLFRMSTTLETGQFWNNVFVYSQATQYPCVRISQEVAPPYVTGGIVNLGVNWIDERWGDGDPWHPVPGELNGTNNFVVVDSPTPIDMTSLIPVAGGPAVDSGQPPLPDVASLPVTYEIDAQTLVPRPRPINGAAIDLGAIER